MDLHQNKLTKSEWTNLEIPVQDTEKEILHLIVDGYKDVNIRKNNTTTLHDIIKMAYSEETEAHLYSIYFKDPIEEMLSSNKKKISMLNFQSSVIRSKSNKGLKKADQIRIQNMNSNIEQQKTKIFEFIQIEFCGKILASICAKNKDYIFYLYTLLRFKHSTVTHFNAYVQEFVNYIVQIASNLTTVYDVFQKSYECIEKNPHILKYQDMTLFTHQKDLFTICKRNPEQPKLILYIAPTGTGKTLSPLGLSEQFKIIFVCAARHVGLALAKSAISIEKKIAFAFGCETASDIRLHYYAASNYTKNQKSGGIGKVDNSAGERVEIMICDVKSYLTAMHYMLAFNDMEEIITYWDEPTIAMDYEEHELHSLLHRNWSENKIPKMVLSCATLPQEEEIADTIVDFKSRFDNSEIYTVTSYDCNKSISLLNTKGEYTLPHLIFDNYSDLMISVQHCEQHKSLMRYFDLREIVRFVEYVIDKRYITNSYYDVSMYFKSISDITLNKVKKYYLDVIKNVESSKWATIYEHLNATRPSKFDSKPPVIRKVASMDASIQLKQETVFHRTTSLQDGLPKKSSGGVLLTTEDAHTLTDGPTIFLAEDPVKISKFYLQQTNIPTKVLQSIMEKIAKNSYLQKKMEDLERFIEDKMGKEVEKEKKMEKEIFSTDVKKLMRELEEVKQQIQSVSLENVYIPNTKQHQMVWVKDGNLVPNAFQPDVDEDSIRSVMSVNVDDERKLLLLLGIGLFLPGDTVDRLNPGMISYMEVLKKLAYQQKLYMIVASSDYIYGTNYQFCHGLIGRDLKNMTQQKTIQAMGRIGRNHIQQEYTVRFREDDILKQLFLPMDRNMEASVMSKLFSTA